jgi:hypothetical protein
MEHRKHPRLNAPGIEVCIADRVGFSTGTIRDISRFGVCITDLPRQLQPANNSIIVVISTKEKQFRMHLKPQWEKQEGLTMATGTVIADVPWDWAKMIMQMEHQNDDILLSKALAATQKRRLEKTLRRGAFVLKKFSAVGN